MRHLLKTYFLLAVFLLIPFSVYAQKNNNIEKFQQNIISMANMESTETISINEDNLLKDEEEKVIIRIINFGRKNPFKPYKAEEEISSKKEILNLDDVPFPPTYQERSEISQQAETLMKAKVNGILYDPDEKSVAIVRVKNGEFMLHEGDMVYGIVVDEIMENSVTLRYESNTYKVSVGEIVEGSITQDPVKRNQTVFAGSNDNDNNELPAVNLEE